jgi:hypothetical protein
MTTDMTTEFQSFRNKLEAIVEAKKTALLAAKQEYDEAATKLNEFVKTFGGEAKAKVKGKPGPKPKAVVPPVAVKAKAKGKPGPKPKAAKAAPAAKPAKAAPAVKEVKAKGKPGPKPKAKPAKAAKEVKASAKAKPAKAAKGKKTPAKSENRRAAEGRAAVAKGLRPPIKDAIAQVMGDKTMNATEIFDILKGKNWLPNANDPRNYIAYVLSSSKSHFERVANRGRGFYKVKGVVASADNGKSKKAAPEKSKSSDTILEEAGIGGGTPVFGT